MRLARLVQAQLALLELEKLALREQRVQRVIPVELLELQVAPEQMEILARQEILERLVLLEMLALQVCRVILATLEQLELELLVRLEHYH